jgi:toxin-antitoxin system PIN domain toxin
VILVDANLLAYAANQSAPEHGQARPWLDARLNGTARVGLPWPSLLAFVRIVSNPAIVRNPVTPSEAWQQVTDWLDCETACIPLPGTRHREVFAALLANSIATSRLVPDAHLAALAIEHGLTLCSTDGDFARFSGLRWENPLAAGRSG